MGGSGDGDHSDPEPELELLGEFALLNLNIIH